MNKDSKKTYGQIIKSSALVGGSTVINVGLGVIRVKVMAVLLGTAGMGLFGNYDRITNLVRTLAGMGVNVSGVRQIAEATGSNDEERIARTVTALRRVALITGALGGLILLILCRPISLLMFKDTSHSGAVALLGLSVFLADISAGQTALVQGMRRISDLARLSVWGAFLGTFFSIPIVYYFYRRGDAAGGVVPSLICVAAMTILTSWWYARKVKVAKVALTIRDLVSEARSLLKMGVVFMSSGFMSMGSAFAVGVIITRSLSLDAAGLYQSAWGLGGLYLGYILQAMGADFYPRLTAASKDHHESNRLVNEQIEVGMLAAVPGVLATLTFTPLVIQLFYSNKFGGAVDLLRWICLGMLLRVASWPMGYYLMARGERKIYFWTELLSNAIYIGLIWIGVAARGLTGAGEAFFGMYVIYTTGIFLIVRRLSGFRWSAVNLRMAAVCGPLVAAVFAGQYFLPPIVAMGLGAVATLAAGVFSARTICSLVPLHRLPRPAQKMLTLFRLAPVAEGI